MRCAEIIASGSRRYPDLGAWISVGGWPVFTRNALDAVDPAKTKFISFDTIPPAPDLLKEGKVQVLIGQKYFGWGAEPVRILADIKAGKPPASPIIDSGVDVVTAANVDAVRGELEEAGGGAVRRAAIAIATPVDEGRDQAEPGVRRREGAAALMIGSHVVLYYLWYAVRFHGGAAPLPDGVGDVPRFLADWWQAVATAGRAHLAGGGPVPRASWPFTRSCRPPCPASRSRGCPSPISAASGSSTT